MASSQRGGKAGRGAQVTHGQSPPPSPQFTSPPNRNTPQNNNSRQLRLDREAELRELKEARDAQTAREIREENKLNRESAERTLTLKIQEQKRKEDREDIIRKEDREEREQRDIRTHTANSAATNTLMHELRNKEAKREATPMRNSTVGELPKLTKGETDFETWKTLKLFAYAGECRKALKFNESTEANDYNTYQDSTLFSIIVSACALRQSTHSSD